MFTLAKWCPLCTYQSEVTGEERTICRSCSGEGSARCSQCLCLDCGGTGEVACTGCDGGRIVCAECEGRGKPRGLLRTGVCKACEGTGQQHHEACDGNGEVTCPSCAGLGFHGECDACGGTGSSSCSDCRGTGLAPSAALLAHARQGALARLLQGLPVVRREGGAQPLSFDDALAGIVSFLGDFHWSFLLGADEREHEGRSLSIHYRFLDVFRSAENAYRITFRESRKDWR